MDIAGCGQMVPWSIHESLLVWHLLYSGDTCLPYLGLDQAIPAPTLSTPRYVATPTSACTNWWANRSGAACECYAKRKMIITIIANSDSSAPWSTTYFVGIRVDNDAIAHKEEQRVINNTPILAIPCIMEALAIMQSRNPRTKQTLKNTPRLHQRITRNNTPGIIPVPMLFPLSHQPHSQ